MIRVSIAVAAFAMAPLASCTSPTGFDIARDLQINVEEAVVDRDEGTLAFTATIRNLGAETIAHGHGCGHAALRQEDGVSLNFWSPCMFPGPEPEFTEIGPNEEFVTEFLEVLPPHEWSEVTSGRYVLELGLWLPVQGEPVGTRRKFPL